MEPLDVCLLYDDPAACAAAAGLRYSSPDEPGLRRMPADRGLAVPPAWADLWICGDADGHLQAVGTDERGRRQYLYHPAWREFRDRLNFHRLVAFGTDLPRIREYVATELRRRTLDDARVVAAMLRIVDRTGIRIGTEVYADENGSHGLSTLSKRHLELGTNRVVFRFPAKSGRRAVIVLRDPGVTRVVSGLAAQRARRLFTVNGRNLQAEDVNATLAAITTTRVTAKDFRTWNGTLAAFEALLAGARPVQAIDVAATRLGNTRAVARAHYVHPLLVELADSGRLRDAVAAARPTPLLDGNEAVLHALLAADLAAAPGRRAA